MVFNSSMADHWPSLPLSRFLSLFTSAAIHFPSLHLHPSVSLAALAPSRACATYHTPDSCPCARPWPHAGTASVRLCVHTATAWLPSVPFGLSVLCLLQVCRAPSTLVMSVPPGLYHHAPPSSAINSHPSSNGRPSIAFNPTKTAYVSTPAPINQEV
jgi:hypothetical protein